MSTVIYQGRNSYLESRFNDNRTLWLKLSSQKPNSQDSLNNKAAPDQFVQCKTSSQNPIFDAPYVHPSVKRSLFSLSEKSLAMCTENLGNESGTDVVGFNILPVSCSNSEAEIPSSSSSGKHDRLKKIRPLRSMKRTAKDFPPPLTTRREGGSGSFHIIPRREDGKLVLEAVISPSSTCLRAERSNGCLRLYMLKSQSSRGCDSEASSLASESKQEVEDEVKNSTERVDRLHNSTIGKKVDTGKFQRPYMCKEVGCRKEEILLNLESFWFMTQRINYQVLSQHPSY